MDPVADRQFASPVISITLVTGMKTETKAIGPGRKRS